MQGKCRKIFDDMEQGPKSLQHRNEKNGTILPTTTYPEITGILTMLVQKVCPNFLEITYIIQMYFFVFISYFNL